MTKFKDRDRIRVCKTGRPDLDGMMGFVVDPPPPHPIGLKKRSTWVIFDSTSDDPDRFQDSGWFPTRYLERVI